MAAKAKLDTQEIRSFLEGIVSGQTRVLDMDKDRDRDKVFAILHGLPKDLPIELVEKAFVRFLKSGHATWELLPDLSKEHLEVFLKAVGEAVGGGEEEVFDSFYLEAAKHGAVLAAHEILGMADDAEELPELVAAFGRRDQVGAALVQAARSVLPKLAKQDALEEDEVHEHMLMLMILARDGSSESIKCMESYIKESTELFPDSPTEELADFALKNFRSKAGDKLREELQVGED